MTVKVTESYVNYSPPLDYSVVAKRLLASVPEKYLIGLDSVVLCNLSGQPRRVRTGTLPQRGRRIKREDVAGLYHPAWRGQKAWIQVFVDQIKIPPRFFRWIRPLTDLLFGEVFYHELGHHAHTIRREYREKEDVAEKWTVRFSVNHLRRSHRLLYGVIRLAADTRRAVLRLSRRGSA
jgi:hypothetical protein